MEPITISERSLSVLTRVPRNRDQNAALVYLASLSAKSGRRTQAQVLRVIASWLGGEIRTVEWGALRYAHTAAIKTRIVEAGYAPATARKMLSALRGTLKAAWRLNQMSAEDLAKATDIGRIGGTSLPAGRYVVQEEIVKLFEACANDPTHAGRRDAALLAVLYGCGLRREELTTLMFADYNPDEGTLLIHGKRDKERLAYVGDGIEKALWDWIAVRGKRSGPLFQALTKSGKVRHGRMSSQAVYNTVYERLTQAGLERFSPHSLRRSFCSNLLDAGVDIVTVSKLAGHVNITTTQLYDRRGEETKRAGAAMLTVPFVAKREENPQ